MVNIKWTELKKFEIAPAQPESRREPWLVALDQMPDSSHLRIQAEGEWSMGDGQYASCGPDGLAGLAIPPDRLLFPDAPFGALLGRIGGSTATLTAVGAAAWETKPFAIGASCIIAIPDKAVGPLLAGFNGVLRPVLLIKLKVIISAGQPTF
jgi:hypothetical protein